MSGRIFGSEAGEELDQGHCTQDRLIVLCRARRDWVDEGGVECGYPPAKEQQVGAIEDLVMGRQVATTLLLDDQRQVETKSSRHAEKPVTHLGRIEEVPVLSADLSFSFRLIPTPIHSTLADA